MSVHPVTNELLLQPETYSVLVRVPATWMDEQFIAREIALAQNIAAGGVKQRLAYLQRCGLVQFRDAPTPWHQRQVRRVAQEA